MHVVNIVPLSVLLLVERGGREVRGRRGGGGRGEEMRGEDRGGGGGGGNGGRGEERAVTQCCFSMAIGVLV